LNAMRTKKWKWATISEDIFLHHHSNTHGHGKHVHIGCNIIDYLNTKTKGWTHSDLLRDYNRHLWVDVNPIVPSKNDTIKIAWKRDA